MSETPMNKLRELCENWAECTDLAAIRKTATPETRAQATGWKQCAAELRAILPDVERSNLCDALAIFAQPVAPKETKT